MLQIKVVLSNTLFKVSTRPPSTHNAFGYDLSHFSSRWRQRLEIFVRAPAVSVRHERRRFGNDHNVSAIYFTQARRCLLLINRFTEEYKRGRLGLVVTIKIFVF